MAISLIQTAGSAITSGTGGVGINWPSNPTAGNLVVVAVADGFREGTLVGTVIDTQGNTYKQILDTGGAGGGAELSLWYAANITGGAGSVTVKAATGAGGDKEFVLMREYSGLVTTNPLDVSGTFGTTTNVSTFNSGTTAITNQGSELVVAAYADFNGGEVFTYDALYSHGTSGSQGGLVDIAMQDRILSATGAQVGTVVVNQASAYAGGIATFKAAVAASTINLGYKTLLGAGR